MPNHLPGIVFPATGSDRQASILSDAAVSFIATLQREFNPRRLELLARRAERQKQLDAGQLPGFLPATTSIREDDWKVSPLPKDLLDRRVEITGPVERKMVINALNSGAKVFMADFEDSTTPVWNNLLEGQLNLYDAVRRNIAYDDPATGKHYELNKNPAVLFVRARGWHMEEQHMTVDGLAMSGSLFDFGLYFFNNAKELLSRNTGPYFYLPKLESHLEARLWNDVFVRAQELLGVEQGSIKATVLIETILASFEMDEILYELREHSAGLNCGRWDYIFSFIKKFAGDVSLVFPDRSLITMETHFMRSYSLLCIDTCHRRGVSAMGGMSALIPIKNDPEANQLAIDMVRQDKEREAGDGHDGTWVAHPGLVPVAMEVFDRLMPTQNQIGKVTGVHMSAEDLLRVPLGSITAKGVQQNIAVALGYLEAWLRGIGCVPLFNLMEDAATAEISRAQLWQWVHHKATTEEGRLVDVAYCNELLEGELEKARIRLGDGAMTSYVDAADLVRSLIKEPAFTEFLTLPAYARVLAAEHVAPSQQAA